MHRDGQEHTYTHMEDELCRKDFMSNCRALEHLLLKNRMLLPAVFYYIFFCNAKGEAQASMHVRQELNQWVLYLYPFCILECEVSDVFKRLEFVAL